MEIGDRVGAILSTDKKTSTVRFIGYGKYVGDFIPPDEIGFGIPNPKIALDSGDFVYGLECWWGCVKAVKKYLNHFKNIEMVNMIEHRKKSNNT